MKNNFNIIKNIIFHMKTNLKLGLILIGIVILTLGCNSDGFLDKTDPGTGSVEGFYNNEEELSLGVNGVYQLLQGDWWGGAFVHVQPHLDGATDNAVVCCSWEYGFTAVADGTMNPATGSIVAWKWTVGYQAITRVNQILELIEEGIPGVTDLELVKWEAELRFLRGYFYNDMSFLYGDVPLILSVLSPDEAIQKGRTPKDVVVQAIIEDLQFAADNLATTPNNGEFGRPTKQAALTLLGKVYLYNEKYTEAASALSQVIAMEGGVVDLEPDYESMFNGTNEQSIEIIWSLQFVTGDVGEGGFFQSHYGLLTGKLPTHLRNGGGWNSIEYSRNLLDDYYMNDGLPIDESPLYDADDIFKDRDSRLGESFWRDGDLIDGFELTYDGGNFDTNGASPDPVYGAPMSTKKWQSLKTTVEHANDDEADYVILRYADVLLMYAEAQNEAAGPDASVYDAVNKVRDRAEMPDFKTGLSQDDMRDEIRHERRIEFVMEGTRYFDLLRWRTAETVIPSIQELQARTFDPSKNYLWPIPQSAVDSNPDLITQNPNY